MSEKLEEKLRRVATNSNEILQYGNIVFSCHYFLSLEQALTQTRWWTDIAGSARIQIDEIRGQIY